jgi:hypothetical protein
MFVVLIVRLNGYDGSKPKIPMVFPGCIHGKEKINDDTLLQLIRDGNGPAGQAEGETRLRGFRLKVLKP